MGSNRCKLITESETWWRIALVIPMVLACHMLEWSLWRGAITDVLTFCSLLVGVPLVRFSSDTFACSGHFFKVEISCTIVDAFLGSIPLLWEPLVSSIKNFTFLVSYFVGLSALNLIRLEFGFVLFSRGVPWWLSHETMSGVFYFALFCWIAYRRHWINSPFSTLSTKERANAPSFSR
jgi:hypothetical protein